MAFIVDARTLSCPQPVVLTQKALEESDQVTTIVDNEVAVENVTRLAQKKGFDIKVEVKKDREFHLHLTRNRSLTGENQVEGQSGLGCQGTGPTVLLLASDALGQGSDELGKKLITAFVQMLGEISPKPDTIVLMNSGVKLAVEGSQVIEDLRGLSDKGVEILACGTCLGYYDIKEQLRVGKISNMYDIASALFSAGRLVTL